MVIQKLKDLRSWGEERESPRIWMGASLVNLGMILINGLCWMATNYVWYAVLMMCHVLLGVVFADQLDKSVERRRSENV